MRRSSIALVLVGVLGAASVACAAASGWLLQSTPNPTPARGPELDGVSCASKGACTAVGSYFPPGASDVTLAERWNGRRWSPQSTPNPATGSGLNSVSCTSNSACTAVGDDTGNTDVTLAELWNGREWSIRSTPNPDKDSELSGVSCASENACIAVGASFKGRGEVSSTLVERWNGRRWSIQATPPAKYGELYGVSCPSQNACAAVGSYSKGTLAESWNGSKWSIQTTPSTGSSGRDTKLLGVSCPSTNVCTAVGYSPKGTLAESWNGSEWSIQTIPSPGSHSILSGVSCVSERACSAVGYNGTGGFISIGADITTLAERWDGTKWVLEHTPNHPGGKPSVLTGVSCASNGACTAVGFYGNSHPAAWGMLAEGWSGG